MTRKSGGIRLEANLHNSLHFAGYIHDACNKMPSLRWSNYIDFTSYWEAVPEVQHEVSHTAFPRTQKPDEHFNPLVMIGTVRSAPS